MKKYLPFAIGLLLALASVSLAQETKPATPAPSPTPKPAISKAQLQRQLIATEKKLWEGWKNKDVKPFKTSLAADSIMVGDTGTANKATALKEMATGAGCDVKSYELSEFKLTMINSGAALLTYKGSAEGTCGGAPIPTVWASSVFVNRGGHWLAFSHQETTAK